MRVATAQAFFDVIASRDVEAGRQLVIPDGVFVSVREVDGRRVVRHFSNAEWLERLPTQTQSYYEAFDGPPEVLVEVEYGGRTYRGRGVSTDSVEASARAFLNAINRIAAVEQRDQ